MACRTASSPRKLSRRDFLGLTSAAAAGLWLPGAWAAGHVDAPGPSPSEREYAPLLEVPAVAKNGAKVPILVKMTHPMDPDHYVTSVQVMNSRDPIPSKGTFHFTPANGQVYLSFQAQIHHGASEMSVTAACNRHGTWSTSRAITVPEDAGG